MRPIMTYFFGRLLNLYISITVFTKALVFSEVASYFPRHGSVAQLDRASDASTVKTMS